LLEHLTRIKDLPATTFPAPWEDIMEAQLDRIAGYPAFVQAVLILLNARQGTEREREDLGRLNAKRRKSGKPPLCEFTVTTLYVPRVVANRIAAGGMDMNASEARAAARAHLVSGHFKTRKTGIFWWSPFIRGGGERVRHGYQVRMRPGFTAESGVLS
jgi:hypothetical protein